MKTCVFVWFNTCKRIFCGIVLHSSENKKSIPSQPHATIADKNSLSERTLPTIRKRPPTTKHTTQPENVTVTQLSPLSRPQFSWQHQPFDSFDVIAFIGFVGRPVFKCAAVPRDV